MVAYLSVDLRGPYASNQTIAFSSRPLTFSLFLRIEWSTVLNASCMSIDHHPDVIISKSISSSWLYTILSKILKVGLALRMETCL